MLQLKDKAPQYKIFCLQLNTPESNWEKNWEYHLPNYKFIEYLDIDPIQKQITGALIENAFDNTELIIQLLQEKNIPFCIEKKYIRIYGYIRPQKQPTLK